MSVSSSGSQLVSELYPGLSILTHLVFPPEVHLICLLAGVFEAQLLVPCPGCLPIDAQLIGRVDVQLREQAHVVGCAHFVELGCYLVPDILVSVFVAQSLVQLCVSGLCCCWPCFLCLALLFLFEVFQELLFSLLLESN